MKLSNNKNRLQYYVINVTYTLSKLAQVKQYTLIRVFIYNKQDSNAVQHTLRTLTYISFYIHTPI